MLNSRATRLRTIVPLAAVTAAVLLLTLLPASPATGQASASTSTLPDAGVLRLRLGAEDHFRFEPTTGSPSTQSISAAGNCKLTLGSSPSLVSFSATPSGAFPGLVSDGIGVRGSGEGSGQPCGRFDAGQTLTLDLVQGAGSVLANKYIDFAEIDLEGKFGATVIVTGYLVQGATATQIGAPASYVTTGPDSGPDSGDGDNFRIRFPQSGETAVNRLVFSIDPTTGGGASLEGGADGTAPCDEFDSPDCAGDGSLGGPLNLNTTDTLFHLVEVDGFLGCSTGTNTLQQTSDGITTVVERQGNADGSTCVPIPVNQDSSQDDTVCSPGETTFGQCSFLQKDLLGQATAQFYWTVTWAPEDGSYMEEETQFDFGNGPQVLQLCEADADDDGFPDLPLTADPEDPAGAVDPWCLVDTQTNLQIGGPNDGKVIVKERYFGFGDPVGHR